MSEGDKKKPVEVAREELYRQVWQTPMTRLAAEYGITGNGLAKICARLNVPYPPRGYWAKLAAGKKVVNYRLPEADNSVPGSVMISPTPPPPKPPELPAEIQEPLDLLQSSSALVVVPERLLRPHKVIANWLTKHEQELREARSERDPWRKRLMTPSKLTDMDRRRHRILDALFKALERHKGTIKEDERRDLWFESNGERITFQLREKHKQTRRPPRENESEWRKVIQELHPTGKLMFSIKTYLPEGFRREWLETDTKSMEALLPEIVAVLIAAIPVMAKHTVEREERARQERIAEQKRREEEDRRQLMRNRVRRFTEFAHAWKDRQVAREFLHALKATIEPDAKLSGHGIDDWLGWIEGALAETDQLTRGVEFVLGSVAQVNAWTYRE